MSEEITIPKITDSRILQFSILGWVDGVTKEMDRVVNKSAIEKDEIDGVVQYVRAVCSKDEDTDKENRYIVNFAIATPEFFEDSPPVEFIEDGVGITDLVDVLIDDKAKYLIAITASIPASEIHDDSIVSAMRFRTTVDNIEINQSAGSLKFRGGDVFSIEWSEETKSDVEYLNISVEFYRRLSNPNGDFLCKLYALAVQSWEKWLFSSPDERKEQ